MIKQYIVSLFLISSVVGNLCAQEMGLYFMDGLWQANQLNPAFMPEQRAVYSFPSIYLNVHHTAASYNDLITTNANGEHLFSLDNVLSNMSNRNFARINANIETMNLSVGTQLWRASLSQTVKFRSQLGYPKALAQLAWDGNEQFVGQTVQIGPNFQTMLYSELAAGFAIKLYKLSVGGRIKVLSGLFDVSTGSTYASVHTDEEIYQLTFATDYQMNIAALNPYGTLEDFEPEIGFSPISKNLGFGIDLGATFEISEEIKVSASLLDIGSIKWKSNAQNYASKGSYTFEGMDISDLIRDDSATFESTIDTLESIFEFKETSNSYSTALPAKMYLGTSIKINPLMRVGGLVYMERYRKHTFMGVAVNTSVHLGKIFTAGLVYSIFNNTYDNIGLSGALKLGPVQLFAMTDNVVAAFKPFDSRNANMRVGLNMAFK